jgi:RimJ/RimL family protein N-acetyltransferase/catechol 2,3-dioxygenase-like lactoylglutathione lyase family enzyme
MSIFNAYMETEQLQIRNIKDIDKPFLLSHFKTEIMCKDKAHIDNDDKISEFLIWCNQKTELIEHNRWIILNKKSDMSVGTVGFNYIDRGKKIAEIGYELGAKHWGKGYTVEVMEKILLFGFKKLMLTRLSIYIPKSCDSIYNTLIRMGFLEESYVFDELVDSNQYSNQYLLSILLEDYQNYLNSSNTIKAQHYTRATIIFPTPNLNKTRDFYVNFLGFTAMSDLTGEQPFVHLQKDDIEIALFKSNLWDVIPNRILHKNDLIYDAYIGVSDIEFLYSELKSLKIKIIFELQSTHFSRKEFVIEDGDGRWIAFGIMV